jgi:Tol biopolymer transport system component
MISSRQVTVLLGIAFLVVLLYRQNAHQDPFQNAPAVNWDDLALTGRLLAIEEVEMQSHLIEIDLRQGATTVRFLSPPESWIEGVALAHDGSIVLTYAPPPSPEMARYSQPNLYQLDGENAPQLLLDFPYPDDLFAQPTWSADGGLYFTHHQPTSTGYNVTIERYDRQEGSRQLVVHDAMSPALSPDGQHMAYIHTNHSTDQHRLMWADRDGSNPRLVLGSDQFSHISAPFFSPQGCQIYFAAAEPTDQHQQVSSSLGAGIAGAHGDVTLVNWWRIACEGGQPERVTKLATMVQAGTFSPDGQWIAFSALDGLYLMRTDTQTPIHIASLKVGESIVWVR